eukprot:TRINITY_DN4793_c0_g1_i3.p1 TRINITY_DN4793_c0_g1~~TRINITY_DN4793_c0_g1_i3.p1  ORF type:complete len:215 (+),score=52.31 TRINITY_DN4793_c0_g1_i3:418-1062(+)
MITSPSNYMKNSAMWGSPIGYLFAEYVLTKKELFSGKRILELGSGIGFTGMVMNLVSPEHLVLTDYTEKIMNLMKDNLEINQLDFQFLKEKELPQTKKSLEIMELNWLKFSDNSAFLSYLEPQLILGCDIIYDIDLHHHLLNTICFFVNKYNDVQVYLANAIRTLETFNCFMELSREKGLDVVEVDVDENIQNSFFHYEKRCSEIKILKLTKKL